MLLDTLRVAATTGLVTALGPLVAADAATVRSLRFGCPAPPNVASDNNVGQ
jgi:hypothetical protein